MKKLLMIVSVLAAANVFANEDSSKPCLEVKKACESAGFTLGQHKVGKGLHKDCMQKLAAGEAVTGVTVSADVVSACKQNRSEHHDKKSKK
jgi:hypothetical protein